MTWRRFLLATFAILTLMALAGGGVVWSLQQPPEFYVEATAPPPEPEVRREQAKVFERKTVKLAEEVRDADAWRHEFTQENINAWLAEELATRFAEHIPTGVSEPRVRLERGAIDVAFRAEDPVRHIETVVSLRAVPEIVGPNRLNVEIASVRAGLLPLPVERIMAQAVKRLEETGWKIVRTQRDGRERFEIDLSDVLPPGASLRSLVLEPGRMKVEGRGAGGEGETDR